MTKTEAQTLAATAHKNLMDRLSNANSRELALEWTQAEAAAKRNEAHVQYMHTIDSITVLVAA